MLASNGEITEPCPVPLSLLVTTPSSRTPALSHFRIRRRMRGSPIRCSTKRTSQSWLTGHTTHLRDHPDHVTIIRERHAFEGQTLAVISSIKRRGVLHNTETSSSSCGP